MSESHDHHDHDSRSSTKVSTNAEFDALLNAARHERPDPLLAPRVLSRLAFRGSFYDPLPGRSRTDRGRWWVVGSLAAALAVIVGVAALQRVRPFNWRQARLATAEPTEDRVPAIREPTSSSKVAAALAPTNAVVRDPCAQKRIAAGREPIIDDFEDGDDAILPSEGRIGLWRWVRDTDRPGSAPALLPIPQPRPTARNQQALHIKGARLLDWGASVEFTFQPACYDASAYRGISLRVKGPGRIYLAAREVRLIPPEGEGTCQGSDCYNVHVKKFDLSDRYATYEARWFELQQRGYGRPPVDPSQLNSLAIFVRPEDTPYDIWIDDLRFIE